MASNGRGIDLSQPLDDGLRAELLARLEAQTVKAVGGCWEWVGYRRNSHYGSLTVRNRPVDVHKLSYAIHVGPIPHGRVVRHDCDNPPCWRPAHLLLGSQAQNVADMWNRGRARPGVTCGAGHHMAKLSDEQVGEIRRRWAVGGVQQRELATEYHCAQSTIWRLVHGVTRT